MLSKLSMGTLLLATAMFASASQAATTDIIQAPTDFFVPTDAQRYDSPFYRGGSGDWEWQHNAIGGSFTTATLSISAFDVDYDSGERDMISIFHNGAWTNLGFLTGQDDSWSYTTFNLDASYFPAIASGLQVHMDIDSEETGWIVTLAKSVLATDGASVPSPVPGVPVPAALPMFVSGLGLFGAMAKRRKSKAQQA